VEVQPVEVQPVEVQRVEVRPEEVRPEEVQPVEPPEGRRVERLSPSLCASSAAPHRPVLSMRFSRSPCA
jgi:hypothetical protein